jgi:hypothetical protein
MESNIVNVSDVVFTREQLATAIEAMAAKQESAVKSIAKVIVMAAYFANVHGDAGASNALMANLRKGVKKDAIAALLETHCNLNYSSGAFKSFDAKKGWTKEEVRDIRSAAANWESFKRAQPAPAGIDIIETFAELVQKLTTTVGQKKREVAHAEALPRLQALLGELKGEVLFED